MNTNYNNLYAPIIIPTCNRVEHLKRCLESIKRNPEAKNTDVYISVDYPPTEGYKAGHQAVVDYLLSLERCDDYKKLNVYYQDRERIKNGLYDFCVSIIQALHCLSNLIVNTNKIHELYLSSFSKLAFKFVELENIFVKIVNKQIEHKKNIFDFKELNYRENILIAVEINWITEKFIDKINSDS